ncbi:MAG: DUF2336 domain-containing protein [Azospirillaceae bacterium]|nr:DUF2336 domain-containing protein [Azospirillaceae bacterium]
MADRLHCLMPDRDAEERYYRYAFVTLALEHAARDRVSAIGAALTSALRDIARYPSAICRVLAVELRHSITDSMLECYATISDDDLLAVALAVPMTKAAKPAAILRLPGDGAGPGPADDHAGSRHSLLLDNHGQVVAALAPSSTPGMAGAAGVEANSPHTVWLSAEVRAHLSGFVDRAIRSVLAQGRDMPDDLATEIVVTTQRRLRWLDEQRPDEPATMRALRLHAVGGLDETVIGDALAWADLDFVRAALGVLARVAPTVVDRIFATRDAKGVTALAWRAGLSMRCAMDLQLRGAKVSPRALLNARDGVDFPLTAQEMAVRLDFHGA